MSAAELEAPAAELGRLLADRGEAVVFAESCTGGLVAATLAGIPGASAWLLGSFVSYAPDCKRDWLHVPAALLTDPGPVSEPVAVAMAAGARRRTPGADWVVSITGHLGPDAPGGLDGVVWVAVAGPGGGGATRQIRLPAGSGPDPRRDRQRRATRFVLDEARRVIAGGGSTPASRADPAA